MFLPLILPYKRIANFKERIKEVNVQKGTFYIRFSKGDGNLKLRNVLTRGLLFSTLLFSLGSTGEFSKAKATAPITIENPKPEGKKLSLWYNEPAKDWENKHCQSVMAIWVEWSLVESNKNVFSLMKNALDWRTKQYK